MEIAELDASDAADLAALYGDHEWWTDRTPEEVRTAIEHTDLPLGVRDDGDLVGAARVLTDYAFHGTVYDVIVAVDRRGEGIGRALMKAIVEHSAVAELDVLDLRCREGLVPFYERVGFEVHDPVVDVDGREESFVKMNYSGNP